MSPRPRTTQERELDQLIDHAIPVLCAMPTDYSASCHSASLAVVKDAPVPCRVARGAGKGAALADSGIQRASSNLGFRRFCATHVPP